MIIGGGIAGCIAAISLAPSYAVTLVDKLATPKDRIGESLAPAANRILAELDLLDGLEKQSGTIFQTNLGMQSYWGSDQVQIVDHMRNPDGFVKSLNRSAFEAYLRKTAEERGVNCLWGTAMQQNTFEDVRWQIQLKSNDESKPIHQISAQYVIDASGRQSRFARSLGIKRHIEDQLMACWLTLPNTQANTMSTISASENGWWYSAVVPNNQRVIAYHTDSDLIDKAEFKTLGSFLKLAEGNQQISELLKGNEYNAEFHGTVAANSTKLLQSAGPNWAAIGDAALSFDPLSSQGMFNAMASAMQLSASIRQYGLTADLSATHHYQMEQIWVHYLKHKHLFYRGEGRWRESEFWGRRGFQ